VGVVVVRKYKDDNRLYVHEVTLKEKLLVSSSPSNEAETQGAVLTVLRKIVSVKLSIDKDTKEELKTKTY
jgi:hypothetical protein